MAQRAPLTQAEKQLIVEKKAAGMSLRQISEILQCSFETVKMVAVRAGSTSGTSARAAERRAIEHLSSGRARESNRAKRLPPPGPKMIRLKLEGELSLEKSQLPSAARLSVLFKQACPDKVQPRQRRLVPPPTQTVTSVHQRWQMDAKEGLPVGAERVNVQEIHDKYSGLMIVSQAVVTSLPSNHWRHSNGGGNINKCCGGLFRCGVCRSKCKPITMESL